MRLFPHLLLLTALLALVLSHPLGDVSKPLTDPTDLSSLPTIFQLPEDFDMSHPALDVPAQLALLEKDPNAVLPQLPANLNITIIHPGISTQARDKEKGDVYCDPKPWSPGYADVMRSATRLIGWNTMWCKPSPPPAPLSTS